ncbi:MAG TPA: phenylacetate--CoA ligase [Gaiellaceae bacterium]|nr:phenylacetate--CoA ligase [Gaiellaceae bacterium]
MIFQPELETMPRPELERLQLERLRERFGIGSFEELAEAPFATKAQLRDSYPFGLLHVPLSDCVRIHASSGTRGKATIVAYTRADVELWADCCARAVAAAGGGPGTVVHVAYGYGLFTGGLGLHYGAERLGCTVVPASGGNTPRQAQLLEDLGAEILCCTPSYALAIADHVPDPANLRLRSGLFGAEPWTEELRGAVEDAFDLAALDIYGLSEIVGPGVSFECIEGRDGAHVNEDHFLVEVVDPGSGERLDDGEVGELVFTTLTKEALPFLRYRSGDLASLIREPCACGRTTARMSRIVGRTDDMLVIRGVNVFPSEIERALLSVPQLAPHYRLVVERPARLDELTVEAELRDGEAGGERLRAHVEERLGRALGLSARVSIGPAGSLPRSEGKALRVVDLRG